MPEECNKNQSDAHFMSIFCKVPCILLPVCWFRTRIMAWIKFVMKVAHFVPMLADDKSRKPQPPPAPYNWKLKFPKPKENSTNPKSSAKASELSSWEIWLFMTGSQWLIIMIIISQCLRKSLSIILWTVLRVHLFSINQPYLGICPRRDEMQISTSLHPIWQ